MASSSHQLISSSDEQSHSRGRRNGSAALSSVYEPCVVVVMAVYTGCCSELLGISMRVMYSKLYVYCEFISRKSIPREYQDAQALVAEKWIYRGLDGLPHSSSTRAET